MSVYGGMLDALVEQLTARLGIPATRDPAMVGSLLAVSGLIVYVQFPTQVGRLLAGPNVEVPVSLLVSAPADLTGLDLLLDAYDPFVEVIGSRLVTPGPVDVGAETYPAVTAVAQIAATTPEEGTP
jgi:hypothetical protein